MSLGHMIFDFLTLGIGKLERRLFARGDAEYEAADRLLIIPVCGAVAAVIGYYLTMVFLKYSHRETTSCFLCFLFMLCGINLLLHLKYVFRITSLPTKIWYFIFLVGTSLAAAFLFYIIFFWISIIWILVTVLRLMHVIDSTPAPRSTPVRTSGGGESGGQEGGGSGSGSEVYELSNGDQVAYDAMTGDYRSTDPLVDNYYSKEN